MSYVAVFALYALTFAVAMHQLGGIIIFTPLTA
jgi:hypothetical protein